MLAGRLPFCPPVSPTLCSQPTTHLPPGCRRAGPAGWPAALTGRAARCACSASSKSAGRGEDRQGGATVRNRYMCPNPHLIVCALTWCACGPHSTATLLKLTDTKSTENLAFMFILSPTHLDNPCVGCHRPVAEQHQLPVQVDHAGVGSRQLLAAARVAAGVARQAGRQVRTEGRRGMGRGRKLLPGAIQAAALQAMGGRWSREAPLLYLPHLLLQPTGHHPPSPAPSKNIHTPPPPLWGMLPPTQAQAQAQAPTCWQSKLPTAPGQP